MIGLSVVVILLFTLVAVTSSSILRELRSLPRPALRLREEIAFVAMKVPSMQAGIAYPPFEDMCETISRSRVLKIVGAPPGNDNPSPIQVFLYSPNGEVVMLYAWYCIASCVLNRAR